MGTDKYIVFSKDFREKLLIFAKTENDVACWYYGNTNIFGYSKIIEENGKTIYRKQIVALKHIIKKIECMAENINARKVEELHFPALRRG